MIRTQNNLGLNRFAGATAIAALLLIGIGGLVTSHEAGLAVPDWPTSYGYNMFTFPVSMWKGGIFYEHTHRLFASGVGLLTLVLAGWLWLKEERAWLRWLGLVAAVLVGAQGVLGGLRVTERMSELGILHAAVAHLFAVLVSAVALFTSVTWARLPDRRELELSGRGFVRAYSVMTAVVFLQLLVAATMRHQHAGLAIPDFPTAYGRLWPDMSPEAVARYNQMRTEITSLRPITAFQIALHMVHRLLALVILCGGAWAAWQTRRTLGAKHLLAKFCLGWVGLVLVQVGLGASTIWTWQWPLITTLHVVVGATTLVAASQLTLVAWRLSRPEGVLVGAPELASLNPRFHPAPASGHP